MLHGPAVAATVGDEGPFASAVAQMPVAGIQQQTVPMPCSRSRGPPTAGGERQLQQSGPVVLQHPQHLQKPQHQEQQASKSKGPPTGFLRSASLASPPPPPPTAASPCCPHLGSDRINALPALGPAASPCCPHLGSDRTHALAPALPILCPLSQQPSAENCFMGVRPGSYEPSPRLISSRSAMTPGPCPASHSLTHIAVFPLISCSWSDELALPLTPAPCTASHSWLLP